MAPLACSAVLALATLVPSAAGPQGEAPPRFHVTLLESLSGAAAGLREEAVAINAQGEAVGSVHYADRSLAAHWSADGELTLLYTGQPGSSSFAYDISDAGVVVGYSVVAQQSRAFQWSAATGTIPLDLAQGAVPLALNGAGTIAYTFRSGELLTSAMWNKSVGTTAIGGLGGDVLVRDLNSIGAATGIAGGGSTPAHAFRWTPGFGTVDLGVPPGFEHSHGNAISEAGTVVGVSRTAVRDQATRWEGSSAAVLLPYVRPANTQSSAFAINAQGWVVGFELADPMFPDESTAVLWIQDQAYALDTLLVTGPQEPDLRITAALDVNDLGQIAARGVIKGIERALRLDPQ